MAKRKYPSELNTRTVRVNIRTWHILVEMATAANKTLAEIVDMLILESTAAVPRSQMALPVFRVKAIPAIAINGNKPITIVSKPIRAEIQTRARAQIQARAKEVIINGKQG